MTRPAFVAFLALLLPLVLALVLGAAACGDGDEATLTPTVQATLTPTPTPTPTSTPPPHTVESQIAEDITVGEAHALTQNNQNNPDFVIIDIRTADEYANGYIETAINLDYYSADLKDELDKLDKNKTYLIYCRTARRSGLALDIMRELGFIEVYNMVGGITQWEAEGLPIVK